MKLIGSLTSPYVRKIRILLLEKKLDFDFVNDSPWEAGTHVPDFNPLGKVPALVTDTGEIFFDSPVIADYVETLGSHTPQLPADALEAVRVRQFEALADGIADAGVAWLLESRRAADKQDAGTIERQRNKVQRGLALLEKHLGSTEWLYAGQFSRADIATGCCLLWLDFRLPGFAWRSAYPALSVYAERLEKRPSFVATVPVA
jgi:glutathione S-transferase